MKEYRVVRTDKFGTFALLGTDRAQALIADPWFIPGITSNKGTRKLQSRELGVTGDDSTWQDEPVA